MPPGTRGRRGSRLRTPATRENTPTGPRTPQTGPGTPPIGLETPPGPRFATPEPDSDLDPVGPAVLASPVKQRQHKAAPGIRTQSDQDVWDLPDEEIIAASKAVWKSDVYDHYEISLRRDCDEDENPFELGKTAEGTSNLQLGMSQCRKQQGTSTHTSTTSTPTIPYSEAAHRALIALRCSKHHRPFNSILDDDYQMEVQMLRPGTKLPHPSTISRDVNEMYLAMSIHVRDYFAKRDGTIHLVLDGWTAPIVACYLGIVVVWYEGGIIHRAILEFIRLTHKHSGEYLAQVVYDCLKRFGLRNLIHALCMDNASNCDSLAKNLQVHLPSFGGMKARGRCFAHIVNLIAKIFISFFFKQPKRRKAVKIAAGSTQLGPQRNIPPDSVYIEEEVIFEEGEEMLQGEDNIAIEEEAIESASAEPEDDGQGLHDDVVTSSLRTTAIQMMRAIGVESTQAEEQMAWQIFPRVAGLARRVHDSPTLKERFDDLVQRDPDFGGSKKALDRRVPTRWNSDFACLKAHLYFKSPIQALTAVDSHKLQAYRLTTAQWELAGDLVQILEIFDDATKLFSKSEVPLIVDAIPILEDIQDSLRAVRDDVDDELPTVVRIAAQVALLLTHKYSLLSADCEIYQIAIVMCPDRKLKWFKDHGRTAAQIKEIKKMVINRFKESYIPDGDSEAQHSDPSTQPKNKWVIKSAKAAAVPSDDINKYLSDPPVSTDIITDAGGYMKYWHQAKAFRPCLSKMGSDYCSIPASSVDAERAFSSGRLQVNHLQHNMNSQTFKAQMAIGSWSQLPLYPGFKKVVKIVVSNVQEQGSSSEPEDQE